MKELEDLKLLKKIIEKNKKEIFESIYLDLKKSKEDILFSEYLPVINEINYFLKNLKKWKKRKKIYNEFFLLGGKSYIEYIPYGKVLIISPWNYPFQLALLPLVGAMGSGNKIILKPSEYSINTSKILKKIIEELHNENYKIVLGGSETIEEILKEKINYIFFTGSTEVGKIIYKKASEKLIPITLELGGKSPVIIEDKESIEKGVEKILWGKFLNLGQTCVAPDYILLPKGNLDIFLENVKKYLKNSLKEGKIINEKNKKRLKELLIGENIIYQENNNKTDFPFTIILNPSENSKIMREEIFGPILPVIEYENLKEEYKKLDHKEIPLAIYIFTKHIDKEKISKIKAGGITINGTLFQVTSKYLPFGGVGASGIGKYHGKYSFETFSQERTIFDGTYINIKILNYFMKKIGKIFSS
ncbi:aldehyde dehydrogenase (NAD+) [Cetobacterium ceti]|uniref:Aldehyde dehydrogenase n=1 Tax=Cetobacterium ceti TaxID=180163 RepID=A0A1T4LM53_9FUSO|nr:aldehyde dehydrogenase family protein [Cetobacterium ceti]SJZ55618.1 aldehyde dehydrogenase (NAD+) [Cetobacterium ceti]